MKSFKWVSSSAQRTRAIGKKIGRLLEAGDVVALEGDLGAGKTTLAKGIAAGLGIDENRVASPTFVVIHEYEGREKVYHLDWYRLDKVEGPDRLSAEECFADAAVTLVEWPERGKDLLPKRRIRVRLKHEADKARSIRLECLGGARAWKAEDLK